MSSYLVLDHVTKVLRQVIWEDIQSDAQFPANLVLSEDDISLKNPTESERDGNKRVSLWLYHIAESEFLRNDSAYRRQNRGFPALPMDLHYLVTPLSQSGASDLVLLGKVMQVFHDTPLLLVRTNNVRNDREDVQEELRVVGSRLSLDQLSNIWQALMQPYRLSICYKVHVARIDSARRSGGTRVIERQSDSSGRVEAVT